MSQDHLIFFSVAGLRPGDVDQSNTPTLYDWANRGVLTELTPTFPCVTSCVQASMWTGLPPGRHGVIANGFYHRDRREVEFWVARNDVVEGEQIWEILRAQRPGFASAAWHAQNIKDAAADFIVTPAPIHEPDGTTKLWCYSKPDGLYQELLETLGHFPLQHYWGPMSNIKSTRWILKAAAWLHERHAPNFHWIYIPHLDYAAQRNGPDSPQAKAALRELDREMAGFTERIAQSPMGDRMTYLAAGEYALTDVTGVIYPNRILRDAGLLRVRQEDGHELIDFERSTAFAMVDHQAAHVYVNSSNPKDAVKIGQLFRGVPGVANVCVGDERERVGMNHPRSGEVILAAAPTHWFAYYWWLDDAAAPPFARTVDIHRKPGYDAVELFFDPATKSIPLNAELIKGSHGAPAVNANQRTALICSEAVAGPMADRTYRDTDVKQIVLDLLRPES